MLSVVTFHQVKPLSSFQALGPLLGYQLLRTPLVVPLLLLCQSLAHTPKDGSGLENTYFPALLVSTHLDILPKLRNSFFL